MTGSSGVIASPLYPSNYPDNAHYEWTVTVQSGLRVGVVINDLDIEMHSSCMFDYVRVGFSAESKLLFD